MQLLLIKTLAVGVLDEIPPTPANFATGAFLAATAISTQIGEQLVAAVAKSSIFR